MVNFYPRPPRGGRLRFGLCAALPVHISIHALREEGDGFVWGIRLHLRRFLSTPSARRATVPLSQLPHAWGISIHALREEGDPQDHDHNQRGRHFYPRPPRGGRQACIFTRTITSLFLSTPSARRATFYRPGRYLPGMISIHALREEGDSVLSLNFDFFDISIHALREEGDPSSAVRFWLQKVFLSTPSARRATPDSRRAERGLAHFYPRPPRGGRRSSRNSPRCFRAYFYPRPPRGGRPAGRTSFWADLVFLSTPSARRATAVAGPARYNAKFLSTPSARRATSLLLRLLHPPGFLSTPSARRATGRSLVC